MASMYQPDGFGISAPMSVMILHWKGTVHTVWYCSGGVQVHELMGKIVKFREVNPK